MRSRARPAKFKMEMNPWLPTGNAAADQKRDGMPRSRRGLDVTAMIRVP